MYMEDGDLTVGVLDAWNEMGVQQKMYCCKERAYSCLFGRISILYPDALQEFLTAVKTVITYLYVKQSV